MSPREYLLACDAGTSAITCHEWESSGVPRATLVVVHGLGDHGLALPYVRLADALVPLGFRMISYDQRGHCRVSNAREGPARLPGLISDLGCVARHAREGAGPSPVVVVGLSMGALVAILACHAAPDLADGLVAASAPLGAVAANPIAMYAATVLGARFSRVRLFTGIDLASITDNRAELAAYVDDPRFQRTTTLGLAADLLHGMRSAREAVRHLEMPTLLLHGMRDPITPWPAGLADELAGERRTVTCFGAGHHNLFLDLARAEVFDTIARWCATLGNDPRAAASV